ncbi:MAG TPA: RNA-binding domain-containing protein [Nitrososphaeraceae archaeon]|nr:RNA-binding domain-containing protein [Nitrososphaeraceae archaeon]
MTLSASIHVVAHATEDIQKILNKMQDVFLIPREKFLISKAEGHWGNEISVIRAECEHDESSALLEGIISRLKIGEKNYLLGSISDSFDEKNNFYIRLNKQSVCKGIISLSEHDSIRIRFKPIKEFNQNNKFRDRVINLFTRK